MAPLIITKSAAKVLLFFELTKYFWYFFLKKAIFRPLLSS